MNAPKNQHDWTSFLKFYAGENAARPTRIGVFEDNADGSADYWLEDGMPLTGIDVDFKGKQPVIEIMLEGYTHVVRDVSSLRPIYSFDGSEEGLDLVGSGGVVTILRFEN